MPKRAASPWFFDISPFVDPREEEIKEEEAQLKKKEAAEEEERRVCEEQDWEGMERTLMGEAERNEKGEKYGWAGAVDRAKRGQRPDPPTRIVWEW